VKDDDLKRGFAKLRDADARRAPTFEATRRTRARRRSPLVVAAPIAGALAAAAALVLWLRVERDEAPMASAPPAAAPVAVSVGALAEPAIAAPIAPLDFLLAVPGHASLSSVPDFDRSILQGKHR